MSYSTLLFLPFAPMLFGAQCILTLVLIKGEICPGQRGRIHKVLPIIAILWLITALYHYVAGNARVGGIVGTSGIVGIALLYFYSQVQTKKTRDRGPLWVLLLADVLALLCVGWQMMVQSSVAGGLAIVTIVLLLGALLAHLLLTTARTRLQAFHRILPFTGIIAAMLFVLTILLQAFSLDESTLTLATTSLLSGFALMIIAIGIWCWSLFTRQPAHKMTLLVVMAVMLSSVALNLDLFYR